MCNISAPDLIGSDSWQLSQKIWVNFALEILLAGVRPLIKRPKANDTHYTAHMAPLDTESRLRQVSHDLAAYKEQILRKYPVNRMHRLIVV